MAGLVAGRFFTKDWEANKDREKNQPGRCQYGTNSSFVFSPQNTTVDVDSSMRVFGVTSIYHARSITKKCLASRRKKLCCWHHPDHNPGNITEAELKTRQILDAFAMLDRLRNGKGYLEEYSFSDPCFEGLRPPLSLDILNKRLS